MKCSRFISSTWPIHILCLAGFVQRVPKLWAQLTTGSAFPKTFQRPLARKLHIESERLLKAKMALTFSISTSNMVELGLRTPHARKEPTTLRQALNTVRGSPSQLASASKGGA